MRSPLRSPLLEGSVSGLSCMRGRRVPKPTHVRRVERAQAIRAELGGRAVLHGHFPPRPKGVHRRKYARLREEVLEIERAEMERIYEVIVSGKFGGLA